MNNAEKFKREFGLYATELWAMSEKEFLEWLNSEVQPDTEIIRCKDCKHWVNHYCYERNRIRVGLFTHDNDYCSWAERLAER